MEVNNNNAGKINQKLMIMQVFSLNARLFFSTIDSLTEQYTATIFSEFFMTCQSAVIILFVQEYLIWTNIFQLFFLKNAFFWWILS